MAKEPGIIVDINTLANISLGGKKIDIFELMEIWQKGNVLFYKGNQGHKPIRMAKNDGVFVDISKLPQKKIDEIFNRLSKGDDESVDVEENIDTVLKEIKEKNSKPYDLKGE